MATIYILASSTYWANFIWRDSAFSESSPSLIPALKNISHFREPARGRTWMPRVLRIPGGRPYEKRVCIDIVHSPSPPLPCTAQLPRYRHPLYNFVTACSAFRIPLSFHAAGSDVHSLRSATPLRRASDREEIKFTALDSHPPPLSSSLVQLTNSRCKHGNPHVSFNTDTYLRKHVNLWNIDDIKLLSYSRC